MEALSTRGARFIGNFEGFIPHPYDDGAGNWTIGFGHTKGVTSRTRPISRTKALVLLQEDAHEAQRAVARSLRPEIRQRLKQPQIDMLISLAYNIGGGGFASSTVARELNAGHVKKAADAFLLWNKIGGVPWAGLTRRRNAERRVFLHGYPKQDR